MCVLGPNYMPVQVSALFVRKHLEFDLYQEIGGKPQLFKSKNFPLMKLDLKSLERRGCEVLYIAAAHKGTFIDVLSENLTNVLGDKTISISNKFTVLSQLSEAVLFDVFQTPTSRDVINRAVRQCEHHVTFASDGPEAQKALAGSKSGSPFPIAHALAVSNYSILLGFRCGIESSEDLRSLGVGALLHEVGKTIIDPNYYMRPGKQTPITNTRLRNYPKIGRDMMSKTGVVPSSALKPIVEHQERLDGSGYPSQLSGKQISTTSRIVAICDAYDEAVHLPNNGEGISPFKVLRRMRFDTGKFDDGILVEFIKMLGEDFSN
ncbi:MAG: HD domain-containing phosphohydrolase [Candidatus Zixiibacteriota bacterium]